jgi:hypothetical protein
MAALVVIASFILEASVAAPFYAYLVSAVGAVFVIAALILSMRERSRR